VKQQLRVNPVACSGHGLCAELLPELITLDEWGYPLLTGELVPGRLAARARRAVTDCPALALMLSDVPDALRADSEPAHTQRTGSGPMLRA
jgi:ferredoxin